MNPLLRTLTVLAQAAVSAVAAELTEPKDFLTEVPREVLAGLGAGPKKMEEATAKGSEIVAKARGQTATLTLKIDRITTSQRDDAPGVTRYVLAPEVQRIRAGGASFHVHISAFLDASQSAAAAKLRKGQRVAVTGKVAQAELRSAISYGERIAILGISLEDAKLKE